MIDKTKLIKTLLLDIELLLDKWKLFTRSLDLEVKNLLQNLDMRCNSPSVKAMVKDLLKNKTKRLDHRYIRELANTIMLPQVSDSIEVRNTLESIYNLINNNKGFLKLVKKVRNKLASPTSASGLADDTNSLELCINKILEHEPALLNMYTINKIENILNELNKIVEYCNNTQGLEFNFNDQTLLSSIFLILRNKVYANNPIPVPNATMAMDIQHGQSISDAEIYKIFLQSIDNKNLARACEIYIANYETLKNWFIWRNTVNNNNNNNNNDYSWPSRNHLRIFANFLLRTLHTQRGSDDEYHKLRLTLNRLFDKYFDQLLGENQEENKELIEALLQTQFAEYRNSLLKKQIRGNYALTWYINSFNDDREKIKKMISLIETKFYAGNHNYITTNKMLTINDCNAITWLLLNANVGDEILSEFIVSILNSDLTKNYKKNLFYYILFLAPEKYTNILEQISKQHPSFKDFIVQIMQLVKQDAKDNNPNNLSGHDLLKSILPRPDVSEIPTNTTVLSQWTCDFLMWAQTQGLATGLTVYAMGRTFSYGNRYIKFWKEKYSDTQYLNEKKTYTEKRNAMKDAYKERGNVDNSIKMLNDLLLSRGQKRKEPEIASRDFVNIDDNNAKHSHHQTDLINESEFNDDAVQLAYESESETTFDNIDIELSQEFLREEVAGENEQCADAELTSYLQALDALAQGHIPPMLFTEYLHYYRHANDVQEMDKIPQLSHETEANLATPNNESIESVVSSLNDEIAVEKVGPIQRSTTEVQELSLDNITIEQTTTETADEATRFNTLENEELPPSEAPVKLKEASVEEPLLDEELTNYAKYLNNLEMMVAENPFSFYFYDDGAPPAHNNHKDEKNTNYGF